jgi:hypothetical protein
LAKSCFAFVLCFGLRQGGLSPGHPHMLRNVFVSDVSCRRESVTLRGVGELQTVFIPPHLNRHVLVQPFGQRLRRGVWRAAGGSVVAKMADVSAFAFPDVWLAAGDGLDDGDVCCKYRYFGGL